MQFDFITDPQYKTITLIKKLLTKQLNTESYRCYLSIHLEFKKKKEIKDGDLVMGYRDNYDWYDIHLNVRKTNILNTQDITNYMDSLPTVLNEKLDIAESRLKGSGWEFEKVLAVNVNIIRYTPTIGGSYIPLPKELSSTKAIINPINKDDKCFMWAVLAALYPVASHPERVANYYKYEKLFDWSCVSFPTTIDQIECFEQKHDDISINVYRYDNKKKQVSPCRLSKSIKTEKHINLLLLEDDENEKSHYTFIKNYSRLFSSQLNHHNGAIYPCYYCNKPCTSQDILNRHMEACNQLTTHEQPLVKMPNAGSTIEFKNNNNKFKAPFALVVDFEAVLEKAPDNDKNLKQKHLPCSFGVNMMTDFKEYELPPTFYLGKNANDTMDNFYNTLAHYENHIFTVLRQNKPMIMNDEDKRDFKNATHCHICEEAISTDKIDIIDRKTKKMIKVPDKVRDHCHITGKYRGAAHYNCNINFNYKNYKIPVIIHNLKNYDAHFIIQYYNRKTYTVYDKKTKTMKEKETNIDVIANNQEKYMSFTIGRLKFLDSFQFLSSGLDKLVDNLKKNGYDDFKYTRQHMGHHWQLACEKGIYPYEYMDNFNRFNETQLPPIKKFYSALTESHITNENYEKAIKMWNLLDMKTLKDYHDFYLKCDVFLLTDVFDTFRNAMLKSHKLDPIHYITLPSFSWDAALKQSKIELELLTDEDMLYMMEKGIRGGISVISHRHAKANNKYMNEDYDKTKESSYIIYLDANNLYGEAMCQPLPYAGFEWNNNKYKVDDVMAAPSILNTNAEIGDILEVDLEYPQELHQTHNDFPLAPESMLITNDMLSPWASNQQTILGLKENTTKKLCTTLMKKIKYVVHSRNLQYYIEQGMRLTAIHRVVSFKQKPWLQTYINVNTELRKKAKTDFEKDLYKLLNNAVFGKTMENIRGRIEYEIVQTPKRARSITQSAKFKTFSIINNDLVGVQSHRNELKFNKPIYCGLAILDLSKLHMYKFHYDHMKPQYNENIKLLGQDTDSLIYHIKTEDLYKDMQEHNEQYDFGSYPEKHFLYDPTNNKVQGKFKDETSGIPIAEWVGLAPKMYSIKLATGKEKGTAKGVKKTYYKNHITHENYVKCITSSKLTDMRQSCKFLNFRSVKHNIGTYEINKYSLTNYDNKRCITDDGVSSLAYGYRANAEAT